MSTNFENPISFRRTDGWTKEFRTFKSLARWAKQNADHWSAFAEKVKVVEWFDSGRFDEAQIAPFNRLISAADNSSQRPPPDYGDLITKASKELARLGTEGALTSQDVEAGYLMDLADSDPQSAYFTLAAWCPNIVNSGVWIRKYGAGGEPNQIDAARRISAWLQGHANAALFDFGIKSTARSERIALRNLHESGETIVSGLDEELSKFRKRAKQAQEQLAALRNREIRAIAKSIRRTRRVIQEYQDHYNNTLALQAPIEYWTKKAVRHQRAAESWRKLFIRSLIAAGVLTPIVYIFGIYLLAEAKTAEMGGTFALVPVSLGLIIMFFIIWGLRFLVRQYNIHSSQQHDAQEREVFAKSFLALSSQGHLKDEDRILLLQAILRPSAVTATDDGPQTPWEAILRRAQDSSSKPS